MNNPNLWFIIPIFLIITVMTEAQIVVIVNENNSVSDIRMDELKNIYLGNITSFSNGGEIILAELTPLTEQFYKIVLGKTPMKVRKHWIGVVFSGGSATPPTEFISGKKAKEFVLANPGAICFMELSEVNNSMKILTINGKKPGDKDYPLR